MFPIPNPNPNPSPERELDASRRHRGRTIFSIRVAADRWEFDRDLVRCYGLVYYGPTETRQALTACTTLTVGNSAWVLGMGSGMGAMGAMGCAKGRCMEAWEAKD